MSFRNIPAEGVTKVANSTERLAFLANDGDLVEQLDDNSVWAWNEASQMWVAVGSGGGGGGITSINSQTGASQTIVAGTAGVDFAVSSAANTHTLNLPDAGSAARGVVSTGTQTFGGDKEFDGTVTLAGDPTTNLEAATKQYVDSLVNGLKWKQIVRVATTAAGTLASDFEDGDTVDGVTLATGDRILIKNQVDPIENGIYDVEASGAPTRSSDADSGTELDSAAVIITDGTANGGKGFTQTEENVVIGTDSNLWEQFLNTTYTADGDGIELSGTTFSLELDGTTLSKSTSGLKLGDTAVTPGSFTSANITVDQQGRITAAASGAAGGVTSLNSLTGALTIASGTAGTDFAVSAAGSTVTLDLPTASASNRGALSTADWTDFDSKMDGAGVVVDNTIVRFDGTSGDAVQGSGILIDDNNEIDVQPGQIYSTTQTLSDGANISWNVRGNQVSQVTLAGNRTLDNQTNGRSGAFYTLRVVQDGTGSRTLAFGTNYKFPSAVVPTLSPAAGAIDIFTFFSPNGTLMELTGFSQDVRQ